MSTKNLTYYLGLKYPALVQEDPVGGYFVTHPDLDGCMSEGDTVEEAVANLADAREIWIETRLENGYPVPEPTSEDHSGRISLRMAPSLHASLAAAAERKGISLNLHINTILATSSGREEAFRAVVQELREIVGSAKIQSVPSRAAVRGAGESQRLLQPGSRETGKVLYGRNWGAV